MLPFLWPLADSGSGAGQAAAALPAPLRQQLLAALGAYPLRCPDPAAAAGTPGDAARSAAMQQLGQKRDTLLSSLRAVWG